LSLVFRADGARGFACCLQLPGGWWCAGRGRRRRRNLTCGGVARLGRVVVRLGRVVTRLGRGQA